MPEHPQSYFQSPISGAPVVGVNAVQTTTIGGTPTGGSFKYRKDGVPTAAIPWSNVNATLLASIQSALNAAYGTNSFTATAGTLAAGIGTILVTAGAKLGGQVLSTMTVENNLTGTTPTVVNATTTAGVNATNRDAPPGGLTKSDNGNVYRNASPAGTAVSWVAI